MADDMNGCTNCDDYVAVPGLCSSCRRIFDEGVAEERARAVAWLKDHFFSAHLMPEKGMLAMTDGERAAFYLGRGDHAKADEASNG